MQLIPFHGVKYDDALDVYQCPNIACGKLLSFEFLTFNKVCGPVVFQGQDIYICAYCKTQLAKRI